LGSFAKETYNFTREQEQQSDTREEEQQSESKKARKNTRAVKKALQCAAACCSVLPCVAVVLWLQRLKKECGKRDYKKR